MTTVATRRSQTVPGLLRRVWTEYQRDYARYLAAAMVYYALVSMVPLLLLLLSVLGLLLRFSDVAAAIEQDVLHAIESSLGTPLRTAISELLDQLQQESVVGSAIGLGALLIAGSALFRQLRLTFRAVWKYNPPLVSGTVRVVVRSTVIEQAAGYAILLCAGALLLVGVALLAILQWLASQLGRWSWIADVGWLGALVGTFVMITLTFAMLYRFLPPVRVRWRHIWTVAVICAIAYMIASEVVTLYGLFFAGSYTAWGVIGGLLMAMLWMNVVSQILFYGAELCKVMSGTGGSRVDA